MKTLAVFATLMLAAAAASSAMERIDDSSLAVTDQYIVVLRHGVVRESASVLEGPSVRDVANSLALLHDGNVQRTFEHSVRGFVVHMNAARAAALAADPRVAYVEADALAVVAGQQLSPPSWGLDRIDQRTLPLNALYSYSFDGTGVDAYIIDTGIRSTHHDFGARVDTNRSFAGFPDGYGIADCNGHGTHVAGTLGGTAYGVAKGVTLHAVRVLGCGGSGTVSQIIGGVDWVTADHRAHSATPAVANVSIEVGPSQALQDAVAASIAAGVTYAVAAGNMGYDACQLALPRVSAAITVGASDAGGTRWASSDFGTCVDLFAPGSSITSDYNRSDTDYTTMSGTSMATPHVAGVAAIYLQQNPAATPDLVQSAILGAATVGQLTAIGTGSPNLLLYSAPASSSTPPAPVATDAPPTAQFKFNCGKGRSCSFTAAGSSDDHGITSYAWDFGDGTSGSGFKSSHVFGPGTVFPVRLYVTDTIGQTTSIAHNVRP